MSNNLDKQYLDLAKDILENGVKKSTRNGDVMSVFGRTIRHKMSEGFPLLTTKKMYFKGVVTELLWFLQGRSDLKYLLDNNCHIWDGDAYKNYEKEWLKEHPPMSGPYTEKMLSQEEFIERIKTDDEFAKTYGDLGKIYGIQWRKYESINQNKQIIYTDQIENLINDLKYNPDSRRMLVSAWNPGQLDEMVLPPCHYGFQIYTRELSLEERNYSLGSGKAYKGIFGRNEKDDLKYKELFDKENRPTRAISLMFNMRSTDVGLGLPFNLVSYGLLLLMIAKQVNMAPDELIYNGGDVHIYSNHIDLLQQSLDRTPYELPKVILTDKFVNDISSYSLDDIILENYQYHPSIKLPLSN